MVNSGVPAFDSTIHTTNIWLNELLERLGWTEKQRAYHALRVVLHALRDHLPVDQAAALGAQLPMLVRGIYYEGWHPAGKPLRERSREEFLAHIATEMAGLKEAELSHVTRAVFHVLAKHVTPGEVKHLKITLPKSIRDLWSEESHSIWF